MLLHSVELFWFCPTVSFIHTFLSYWKLSRYNRPLRYLFHILMVMFPYPAVPPQYPILHLPPHVYFSMSLNYFESLWYFSSIMYPSWISVYHIEIYFLPVCVTWGPFSAHFSNDRLHIGNVSLNDPLIFHNCVMSCYPLLYIWNTLHLPCLETCFLGEACSKSHTMSSEREGSSLLWLI